MMNDIKQIEIRTAEPTKETFRSSVRDVIIVSKRNVKRILRTPRLLIFSSLQPIMFFTLFRYIFENSLGRSLPPGVSYVDFLFPGVLVQVTLFGGTTAIALSIDMASGMIDRFRSLPIARSAVLAGRTIADITRNIFVSLLLLVFATLMGFSFGKGALHLLAALGIVLLFAFCFSWFMAFVGLVSKDPETAQLASFLPLFPFIFASTIFQPIQSFPTWLQGFAEHQPISVTVTTARNLILGGPVAPSLWQSLMWCAIFFIVFVPLSIRTYRKMS